MRSISVIRGGLAFLAFAAVACAQAQINIYLVSTGTAAEAIPPTVTGSETVVQQFYGAGALSTLSYSFSAVTGVGSGIYTDPSGAMLDFSMAVNIPSGTVNFNSISVDGDWTYTGGTMGYAGLNGGGTLAFNYLLVGSTVNSGTLFSGLLTPEPAPFAAVGLGVVGLLVRRRRKA